MDKIDKTGGFDRTAVQRYGRRFARVLHMEMRKGQKGDDQQIQRKKQIINDVRQHYPRGLPVIIIEKTACIHVFFDRIIGVRWYDMKGMTKWMIAMLLFLPCPSFAGEECVQLGGTCREACLPDEVIEVGAFLDCSDKQECCMKTDPAPAQEQKTGPDTEKQGAGPEPRH